MISKHKGAIFLYDIERAELHNQKLETGNGGQKVFRLEVRIRIDIHFWRYNILLGIGSRSKRNRTLKKT